MFARYGHRKSPVVRIDETQQGAVRDDLIIITQLAVGPGIDLAESLLPR